MSASTCQSLPEGLEGALKGFVDAHGRHAIGLREPKPLFDHLFCVMSLAADRPMAGLPSDAARVLALRQAARQFVQTVMLRPHADHLTLLGLELGFSPEQLRAHYRLMIRLTHPDRGALSGQWPADAAARINLAHAVLSSPEDRFEYLSTLAAVFTPAESSAFANPASPTVTARTGDRGSTDNPLADQSIPRLRRFWRWGLVFGVLAAGLTWFTLPVVPWSLKSLSPAPPTAQPKPEPSSVAAVYELRLDQQLLSPMASPPTTPTDSAPRLATPDAPAAGIVLTMSLALSVGHTESSTAASSLHPLGDHVHKAVLTSAPDPVGPLRVQPKVVPTTSLP